eukprot:CAMPEP_0167807894 /NCGR_PEP_ID=MMETSP0111_2-20121227/22836_1 /TAXON_ID=91324 /ORGANISM="Lotharella globosa, Strain CCCM811" /LENGTH=167 /DNA_ID=CAMNT_0007705907 /DNA_START=18 /DNA_END=521 /DNA_ORIENTATION=+
MALGVHLAVHQAKSTREAERHLPAIRKAPRARHRRDVPIATTLQRRQVVLFAKTPKNVALEAWAVVTWAAAKRTKAKLEVQGHGNQGIAHAEPLVVSSIIVSVHAHLGKHAWPAAAKEHTRWGAARKIMPTSANMHGQQQQPYTQLPISSVQSQVSPTHWEYAGPGS